MFLIYPIFYLLQDGCIHIHVYVLMAIVLGTLEVQVEGLEIQKTKGALLRSFRTLPREVPRPSKVPKIMASIPKRKGVRAIASSTSEVQVEGCEVKTWYQGRSWLCIGSKGT